MKISELRKYGEKRLLEAEIPDYAFDAKELLFFTLDIDMNQYLLHMMDEVSDEAVYKYKTYIEKRASHIPLQHITEEQNFMGFSFYVNEHVLVPRFDTENLVEEVLKAIPNDARILDVCTGSGCILLSILGLKKDATGIGTDLSEEALKVAKINRERLGLADRASLVQGDLFESIDSNESFDIIVSNPPYIRTDVIESLSVEVKSHDPYMALDGGEDGLVFYEKISAKSPEFLKDGGMLFFEIGHDQADDVMGIMQKCGFIDINMIRDYSDNPRVVYGTKKGNL
jgi:release factor glutamine methyltransferase